MIFLIGSVSISIITGRRVLPQVFFPGPELIAEKLQIGLPYQHGILKNKMMAKIEFTQSELLILQIVLISSDPEYVLKRYPIAVDDLKQIIKGLVKKISELLISPNDPGQHPLAANQKIFDKHHDKINGAVEYLDGVKHPSLAEEQTIAELLIVIGELCGKQLLPDISII